MNIVPVFKFKKIVLAAGKHLAVALVYGVMSVLTLSYFGQDTLFFLPAGFAVTVVLLGGRQYFWSILLSVILVNLCFQSSLAISVGMAVGSACGPLLVFQLIRIYANHQQQTFEMKSLSPIVVIVFAVIGTVITPLINSSVLLLAGQLERQQLVVFIMKWWMGDVLGVMVMTPLMLNLWKKLSLPNTPDTSSHGIEATLMLICTFLAGLFIYFEFGHRYIIENFDFNPAIIAKVYWLSIMLVWSVLRLEKHHTNLFIFLVALMGAIATYNGLGSFYQATYSIPIIGSNDHITAFIAYWFYIAVYSMIGIIFSEVVSQYKIFSLTLNNQNAELNQLSLNNNKMFDESRTRFYAMIDNLAIGIWYKDINGNILSANQTLVTSLGFVDLSSLLGKKNADVFSAEIAALYDAEDAEVIKSGQSKSIESYHQEIESLICSETNVFPVLDAQGIVKGTIGYRLDITEKKKHLEQITLLSYCLSLSKDMVMICDASSSIDLPNPRIIYVNDAYCQFTGYAREEVIGNHPRILQGPNTDRASLDKIRKALNQWQSISIDVLNYTKSGSEFWQNLNIFPIANAEGWYTHWIAIQRDVTLQKQHENQLNQAKEKAEQLSLAKTQFLANMSHEIRTPMNGVIGLSALALDCTNLEEIKPFLQRINQSSVSLMAILNDILDLSKIQEQCFSLDNRTFMLDDLITPLNDLFNLTAQQSGVSFSMLCDQHIPPYLWGDELRLRQVLVNLLGNAFKFTAQGEVSLAISVIESSSLHATNVRLTFCVSDTGMGLSTEQVNLIFERFTQADASVTRSFGGTGLGLTISQELVRAMGGEIQVQSSLGQGAVFFFELDFKRMDNPAPLVTNNVSEISAHNVLQGKRVLMVEDDNINQLVTGLLLKKIGVEYEIAKNGEIALECIKNKAYDLILMDVQMPVMDGIQATQQLRQLDDYKTLPIIAMSAGVMLEEKQACTNAGMNGFVAKPTTIEQLTKELLRLLA